MITSTEPIVIMTRAELDAIIRQTAESAAAEVARKIGTQTGSELWDAEKVGEYLGVSAYTVAHDWAYLRGFPDAIVLGDGPRAKRRWRADEIIEWAQTRKARKAA